MNILKIIILFFSLFLSVISCKKKTTQIGSTKDYKVFIEKKDTLKTHKLNKKLHFWEHKLEQNPSQYPYLNKIAALYEKRFALHGAIQDIITAEKLYQKALIEVDSSQVNTLHSLCRNYISQHKFKDCLPLLQKATQIGYKLNVTHHIFFDVHLELGNIDKAKSYLSLIRNPDDFNYLIRKSKWEDYQGNLDQAIGFLELAKDIVEKQGNDYLKTWSYANLGDYYGHRGSIQKAYEYYLKTLQLDPNNYFALKGIAWIEYAHNKNTTEANKIIDTLLKRTKAPNIYLLKAELAEYNNDTMGKIRYENRFLELASRSEYGVMYNTPKALLLAKNNPVKAIELAMQEVTNRPTAISYNVLAWCVFKNNEYSKALELIQKHVAGATSEPEALLRNAIIYRACDTFPKKINAIKNELQEAAFELGPVTYKKVKAL